MYKSGQIVRDGEKIIYTFGIAESIGYAGTFYSFVGVNLETGIVDEIKNNYPIIVKFEDLTDIQQAILADFIPIRKKLVSRVIVISAKARSGKDYIAELLQRKFNIVLYALADPIREIDRIISGEVKGKNRKSLIMIGQGLRKVDPNIWIKVWLRRAISEILKGRGTKIVCQDVRQPNEFSFFKSLGAFSVKIEADSETRLEIIRQLDGESALDEELLKDETESYVGGFETDVVVNNDYTNDFNIEVDIKVINKLLERGW
ncbi:hypothetical protein [Brevibacillus laterosporus]|uniref:hypothetical protein n=1 Tax=Brevibacillus laterosporus TaxID=1465 RepID=UPI003D22B15E